MKKLTDNEFADFYYKKIYPLVQELDREREILANKIWIIYGIAGILFLFYMLYYSFNFQILFLLWVISSIIAELFKRNYKSKLKSKLYNNIFAQLNLQYTNEKNRKSYAEQELRSICDKSDIFRHDYITIDDIISGDYNNLPFKIYDADIYYYVSSGKNRRRVTAFLGIFLATKINKTLKCETLIKTDRIFKSSQIGNKKAVHLEDVEFEKAFEVYSDDQIEGRYLLTPSFMNRLLEYRNKKYYEIEIFFSNQMGMEENVFLFIHNNKDNFELPIFKKIDKDGFYSVIKEIYDALEIIDALKFEQNIGM